MKRIFLLVAVLLMGSCLVKDLQASAPMPCDKVVDGGDAGKVQVAINGSHISDKVTVCLKGTFDFGEAGSVLINPPAHVTQLTITGISDEGGNKATIHGGFLPFIFSGSGLPELTIENLLFENPSLGAIAIFRENKRVEVFHVEIDGVNSAGGERYGILVVGFETFDEGELVIWKNTVVAGDYTANDATLNSIGIFVISELFPGSPDFKARVWIEGNILKDWSGIGIYNSGPDNCLIEGNLIEPGEIANKHFLPWVCQGNGIAISHSTGSLIQKNKIHKVANHYIGEEGPPHCTIGMFIGNDSYHNTFLANQITGEGHVAIDVVAPGAGPANDNVFIGNNLSGFVAYNATIGLGRPDPAFGIGAGVAENNTFVGNSGTVTGNVEGNTITGLTPIAGGVGNAVSGGVSP